MSDPLSIFPFHLHLNVEELETAFLISVILTETHKTIGVDLSTQKKDFNNTFVQFLQYFGSNVFACS